MSTIWGIRLGFKPTKKEHLMAYWDGGNCSCLKVYKNCESSGVHRALSSNGHLPIENEKEISDDELKQLRVHRKNIKGYTESASDDEKPDIEINKQDVVARIDITPQLTDTLINEFSDRDWKVNIKSKLFK